MNKDITTMLGLQKYWQNMMLEKKNIDRLNKTIEFWKSELASKKKEKSDLQSHIMDEKNRLKKNELELSMREEKIGKLEHKKTIIQTQKELSAVDHEITTVRDEKSVLEDSIIGIMDEIETSEKSLASINENLPASEKKVESDIQMISADIIKSENIIKDNQAGFDGLIKELNPSLQGKFTKMLTSKNGIAIAEISGEVCTGCNFVIPASLTLDASKNDKIVNCTNCGRYIYKQ